MSYRIEYNAMEVKHEKKNQHKVRQWVLGIVCMLGIVTGMYVCGLGDCVKAFLLPGDAEVTEAAFSGLVANMQQGQSAVVAFTSFCQEILDHADVG